MAVRLKALIDLDLILDVLQRRQPTCGLTARVFASAETGLVEGWVAAHSPATLFYLFARYQSSEHARVALTGLLAFLPVTAVDEAVVEQALNLPYPDFEHAVQMMARVRSGVQYLVTRNVRDYRMGPLLVLQPAELLALV